MKWIARRPFRNRRELLIISLLLLFIPLIMAPGRCGTSAGGFFSSDPAPDMRGTWSVQYDNTLEIQLDLGGGAVQTETVPANGGTVTFLVNGNPVELNLDCSKDWITCPSEVWTDTVAFDQPNFVARPHQVEMSVTDTECSSPRLPVEADGECVSGSDEFPCDEEICDPENVQETRVKVVASISNPVPPDPVAGSKPEYTLGILLNGGFAVPTANCVLLAASTADADIVYDGNFEPEPEAPTMSATDLENGLVNVHLLGACFWGQIVDEQLRAALLSAHIRLSTGFTASKQ